MAPQIRPDPARRSLMAGGLAALALGPSLGCTKVARGAAPPADTSRAAVPGIPGARHWGDTAPDNLDAMAALFVSQRRAAGLDRLQPLVLSGGADYGAYGAAVMNGMTDLGIRPEFSVVTGVSTGALSAPFVFLGPRYDKALRALYGQYPARQIARPRGPLTLPGAAGLASTEPLARLIDAYVTPAFLEEIAAQHRRGRRLYVMSTNLDAQRPVIWDLGTIASSNSPTAAEVFRNALMASSAIPIAFDPVLIRTEVDGQVYEELHVDGGVIGQVALNEGWQRALVADAPELRPDTIWVVINNRLGPEPGVVKARVLSIAGRTSSTMVKYQLHNDLLRARAIATKRGARFRATWIGPGFPDPYVGPFDPDHLAKLYDYGYAKTMAGKAWSSELPF